MCFFSSIRIKPHFYYTRLATNKILLSVWLERNERKEKERDYFEENDK